MISAILIEKRTMTFSSPLHHLIVGAFQCTTMSVENRQGWQHPVLKNIIIAKTIGKQQNVQVIMIQTSRCFCCIEMKKCDMENIFRDCLDFS